MAYLARLKRGNKSYYYLVENILVGYGRRKQVRKYIGTEKPSESGSQALISDFEKEVGKQKLELSGYHYLTKEEIFETDRINSSFWKRYGQQNESVQGQFDQNFLMAFVYNTNSIEGSTLTPKEVALLLSENIAPNKPLDDILEAKGAQRALEFIQEYLGAFDLGFLLKLHEIYFKETKPKISGKLKTIQNRVIGSNFDTTPPKLVLTDLKNYFKDFEEQRKKLHPIELAAWAHWKIVRIHPFQDGNGRIARLTMNYVLQKNHYAMIDIKTMEKQPYFKALEKCNYNNNARALAIRLVRRFKKQYQNALKKET